MKWLTSLIMITLMICTGMANVPLVGASVEHTYIYAVDDSSTSSDTLLINGLMQYMANFTGVEEGAVYLNGEIGKEDMNYRVTTFIYKGEARVIVGANSPDEQVVMTSKITSWLNDNNIENEAITSDQVTNDDLTKLFEEEQTCTDSDDGKEYYERGTIMITNGIGASVTSDYCIGNTVNEYYCSGNEQAVTDYNCENGCEDGACKTEEVRSCTDSDDGKDFFTKGSVVVSNGNGASGTSDYCSQDTVKEYYCSDNEREITDYYCENGCEDGACLTEQKKADLKIEYITVEEGNIADSQGRKQVTINALVRNIGSEKSDMFDVQMYVDGRWHNSGNGYHGLSPNEAEGPSNIGGGSYYTSGTHTVKFLIKPYGADANSANNEMTEKFYVSGGAAALPDLVVENVALTTTSATDNDYVYITAKIRNKGSTDAGQFWVNLYEVLQSKVVTSDTTAPSSSATSGSGASTSTATSASAGTAVSTSVDSARSQKIEGLAAGKTMTKTFGPLKFSEGTHTVMVKADAYNNVKETYETNNEQYHSFYVSGKVKEFKVDVKTDQYTYKPGDKAHIKVHVSGYNLGSPTAYVDIKSPNSNVWQQIKLENGVCGASSAGDSFCSYSGTYYVGSVSTYTVQAKVSANSQTKTAATKFFVKEDIVQKYVKLDEKFDLKEKQNAIVVDHDRMNIRLTRINNVVCVKAPCPQSVYIEVSKLIQMVKEQARPTEAISEVASYAVSDAVSVVEELEEKAEMATITGQVTGSSSGSGSTATVSGGGGAGTGFNLYEGQSREVFGARVTLLKIDGDEAVFVVSKKEPTGQYVYLNQKFELKNGNSAKVLDYKYMKVSLDQIVTACQTGSNGGCTSYAIGRVEMPSDRSNTGIGVEFQLMEGDSTDVFGVSLRLHDLNSDEAVFIVETETIIVPDAIDVGLEPRSQTVEKGEIAKYSIMVYDKRKACGPNERCMSQPKTYFINVQGLPFGKDYEQKIELQIGQKKEVALTVDTSKSLMQIAYTSISDEGVEEETVEEVNIAEDTTTTDKPVEERIMPHYKFSVSVSNEEGNVADTAFGSLHVKPKIMPPEFPTEKVDLKLYKGWNLVSLPGKLVKFLKSECTANKKLKAFVYLKKEQKYVTMQEAEKILGKSFNDYLADNAFWVYSFEDCSLAAEITKEIRHDEISMIPGWNLVPVSESLTDTTILDQSSNCDFSKLSIWDAKNQEWENIDAGYAFNNNDINKGFLAKVSGYCEFGGELVIAPPEMPE